MSPNIAAFGKTFNFEVDHEVCSASKSSAQPPADDATKGDACDEGDDEAGARGGHGVHRGRGQLKETSVKETSSCQKGQNYE